MLDERGEVLLEQRLGTTPKAMKEVFGGMPGSRITFLCAAVKRSDSVPLPQLEPRIVRVHLVVP